MQDFPSPPVRPHEALPRVALENLNRRADGTFGLHGELFDGVGYRMVADNWFEAVRIVEGLESAPFHDPLMGGSKDLLYCAGEFAVDGIYEPVLTVDGRPYTGPRIDFDGGDVTGHVEYLSSYVDGVETFQAAFDDDGAGGLWSVARTYELDAPEGQVQIIQRYSWNLGRLAGWSTKFSARYDTWPSEIIDGRLEFDSAGDVMAMILTDRYLDMVDRFDGRLLMQAWTEPELLLPMRISDERLRLWWGSDGRPAIEALLAGGQPGRLKKLELVVRKAPVGDVAWLLGHDWRVLRELKVTSLGIPRSTMFQHAAAYKRDHPGVAVQMDNARFTAESLSDRRATSNQEFVFDDGFDHLVGMRDVPSEWSEFFRRSEGVAWLRDQRSLRWYELRGLHGGGVTAKIEAEVARIVEEVRPDVQILSP